ncbi:STAS domain-containing protein [Amycolatopsis sp. cmx-4-68]|uniref:STAS domain-containing protein n=1 Tax=Amycolatopsis sp. cmx-4-68 TaxID=2790938 RepID=UPI00397E1344
MTFPESEADGFPVVPAAAMSVSRRRVADALVLSIGGEVDLSTAVLLGDAVTEVLAQAPAVLVLDLTAVTFFASGSAR